MGRKQKYTIEQVVDACKGSAGNMSLVAMKLGCDRSTIWYYAKRSSTVAEALADEREALVDLAESKLLQQINVGYWPAIKFVLGTKGQKRGYTNKQTIEHSGPDGQPLPQSLTSNYILVRGTLDQDSEEDTGDE